MAKFPTGGLNLDLKTLAGVQARGAVGGTSGNQYGGVPAAQQRTASGGATAGTAANPSRVGMAPISAQGGASKVRSGAPPNVSFTGPPGGSKVPGGQGTGKSGAILSHGRTLAALAHLEKVGHGHPNHHAIRAQAHSGLSAAKGAGAPPRGRGFGALGGAGGGVAPAPSFGAPGGSSGLPNASPSMLGGPPPELP